MWRIVGSALASRGGQAVIVGWIALLASAAVATAAWYAVGAGQQVGRAAAAATPVEQRLVTVGQRVAAGEPAPTGLAAAAAAQFPPTIFTAVAGGVTAVELRYPASTPAGDRFLPVNLAYRQEVCPHLALTGACPSTAGEVVVPAALADGLGLAVGDELTLAQATDRSASVRVVGVYQVVDPAAPYWGAGELAGPGSRPAAEQETLFTSAPTLSDFDRVIHAYELVARADAFATLDVDEYHHRLRSGLVELRRQEYEVATSGVEPLLQRVARERQQVVTGVGAGVAVLLLFSWFTLAVVLRQAVAGLRGDIGWSRLRGVPTGQNWLLAWGQGAVPLLVGAVGGGLLGRGVGGALASTIEGSGPQRTALLLTLALVGLTVAGGLVAAVATQFGTLRAPVRDLFRRIPARPRRWRRSVVDLVVVLLALVAVAQALLVGEESSGLPLLAPGLAVLAIALLAAWAVRPVATRLTTRALRAGHLVGALVTAPLARRPGTHRLFALVTVAVGLVTAGFVGWEAATRDQAQRAALELGADRVVTVTTVDAAQLLAAVRRVDPTGEAAMAVVSRPALGSAPPMLAVDSGRLGVVEDWRAEYGGRGHDVAAALRPTDPAPVVVTTDQLVVEAAGGGSGGGPRLGALLRTLDTGEPVPVTFGTLTDAPAAHVADVPACTAGCRLVGLHLGDRSAPAVVPGVAGPGSAGQEPAPGAWVEIYGWTDGDGRPLTPTLPTDPTRWRPALGPRSLGPAISGGVDTLRLTAPPPAPADLLDRDGWVFPVETPVPLPVVAAGWRPDPTAESRLAPLAGAAVPVEVVGSAPLLPRHGEVGVLADLEYAEQLVPFALDRGTTQVWLSPAAPASIVDELRAAGLTPVRVESQSDRRAQLRAEGSAVGEPLRAATALVGLALAAGAVLVVAAQERAGWAAQLTALWTQGLSRRTLRAVGYGGLALVIGPATVIGLGAGLVGAGLARHLHPGFIDGWVVLSGASPHPYPVIGAALAGLTVIGGAGLVAAIALVRRTREALG